jgi:hypothetical protein
VLVWSSYPARFAVGQNDPDMMVGLAAVMGGRLLVGTTEIGYGRNLPTWQWHGAWQAWLLLAIAAFLATLVGRYMSWPLGFQVSRVLLRKGI